MKRFRVPAACNNLQDDYKSVEYHLDQIERNTGDGYNDRG